MSCQKVLFALTVFFTRPWGAAILNTLDHMFILQFLTSVILVLSTCRAGEYERELLDDQKWADEYKEERDMSKTANELLDTCDDPKFSNSEVRSWCQRV